MIKEEIEISGKILSSLKRASEVSGYAKDYIGQLCRANKIISKRIGRDWFIDINELLLYKEKATQIKKQNGLNAANKFPLQKKEILLSRDPKIREILSPAIAILILAVAFIVYIGKVGAVSEIYQSAIFSSNVLAQDLRNILAGAGKIPGKIIVCAGDKTYSAANITETIGAVFSVSDFFNKSMQIISKIAKETADNIASFPKNIKELAMELFGRETSIVAVQTSAVPEPSFSPLVLTSGDDGAEAPDSKDFQEGLVVIRSSGNESNDEKMKEKIKKSFSDEVIIKPDSTGRSGIIKPVFKNTEGENYLFILVPIKE